MGESAVRRMWGRTADSHLPRITAHCSHGTAVYSEAGEHFLQSGVQKVVDR
jgi:hypothetical protein